MAMAVDNRQQQQQLNGMQYGYAAAPHFTNPWTVSGVAAGQMYATSMPQTMTTNAAAVRPTMPMGNPAPASTMAYGAAPLPSISMPSGVQPLDASLLFAQNSHMQGYAPRPYGATYSAPHAVNGYTQASVPAPQFATAGYAPVDQQKLSPYGAFQDRRASHPMHAAETERNGFSDALDASRGMVAMSQDITPRNIYGSQSTSRSSTDSYGFPSTHSAHSSISSASGYPGYYGGSSVSEASYGDYSSAGESVDVPNRTLPPPSNLMGGAVPPAPSSMMGQFSSKVSSSSQKKHKCKVCDKRFTRPSSLQTHMYSHTGEKPFSCDVDGCGRHFSVVSNLRRHKKVHRGESDHASGDDED